MQLFSTETCRICGNAMVARDWEGAECDRCGCVCVNTLPTEEELNTYLLPDDVQEKIRQRRQVRRTKSDPLCSAIWAGAM